MSSRKPLWITAAVFIGIMLLIAATALIARGRGERRVRNDDAPYPYQWTEKLDGSVRLTLDGSSVKESVWTAERAGDDVAAAALGATKRGKAKVTLTPVSEGRAELAFVLVSGEERLAELRVAVETMKKGEKTVVTVIDCTERAWQGSVSGGSEECPYTVYTDGYGYLVIRLADAGIPSADEASERWTAGSSDELIASVTELRTAEDGVEACLRTCVNGDAEVTLSSEEAGVTYTFALVSENGALRLKDCAWTEFVPETPMTDDEMSELLSGIADSLKGLEAAEKP